MNNSSVTKPYQKRHRYLLELTTHIVVERFKPDTSASRISLDNGLNANMVRRWMNEARQASEPTSSSPSFIPVSIPANIINTAMPSAIRIEIPRAGGSIVVEWPVIPVNFPSPPLAG